jgi:hypothetical protein
MIDEAKTVLAKIDETLFVAEERRLKAAIDALVVANNEVQGQALMGFFYNGDYYIHSKPVFTGQASTLTRVRSTLHMSLNNQMQTHLKDRVAVKLDRDQIRQILHKLLDVCLHMEHVRDALPECLVSLVPDLAKMPRKLPQERFLQVDARLKRQFLMLLPKMEMYAVSRFLY